MFRTFLIAISLTFSSIVAIAQSQDNDVQKKVEADSLLMHKDYSSALPIYANLLNQFPQDKEIMYGLGVCNLLAAKNYSRALSLLSNASTGDVPNMVYFYLAETYRYMYQFDKAIDSYRRYTVNGVSEEVGSDIIERLVNYCDNGNYITRYIFKPLVLDAKKVAISEVYQYILGTSQNGVFIPVPQNLLSNLDGEMGYKPTMFYPTNPEVGDYIYYSSYGRTKSYGTDIYRTQLQDGNIWSKPEPLSEVVNTSSDEAYPYMAPDGVTLYFASKGHYGMGGYDIYRTVFDKASKQWSTLENMGFPFSSPFDDFLYVPSENDSIVAFATARTCVASDSVHIVLLTVNDDQVRHTAKSADQIAEYSMLNVSINVAKPVKEHQKIDANRQPEKKEKPKKSASFRAVENDPEYSRAIAKGFEEQMKADSARVKLEKLREKFDYVETAEQRIKLEKQVSAVEKNMLEAQKQADLMFVRASQIEQEYLTGKRKPAGKIESTFATDNPDYIYQAQFATTVFQDNEIAKLEKAEQLYSSIKKLRANAFELRELYRSCEEKGDTHAGACQAERQAMVAAIMRYNTTLTKYFEQKYPIYDECVHVAVVKSGSDGAEIMDIINTSAAHFRAASAILNNLSEEGRAESEFEASMLRELGLIRMDYVFSKVWGMELMEKRLLEQIVQFDTELFGSSKMAVAEVVQPKLEVEKNRVDIPKIERVNQDFQILEFKVKSEIPADFGIVDTMVYSDANPIPMLKSQPNGVIYRIQIGAYGTPRQPKFFKNMVPITGKMAGKVTKYYVGCFTKIVEAEKALLTVKLRGFKDAFVVAWFDNRTVPVSRAKTLEDEIPNTQPTTISTNEGSKNGARGSYDTQDKVYVVQIGAYSGAMPQSDLKTVKTMVSGKEISRKIDAQGLYVYSVGSFSTVAEAEKIKDNLVASGLLKAMVVTIDI